jgi:hypothetical protein
LEEGEKFCPNCGTKVEVPEILDDGKVLLEYHIHNSYFHIIDGNGKFISAEKAFKKSSAGAIVAGALLGLGGGIAVSTIQGQWHIKMQILKSKVCFTRLTSIRAKPTDAKIEVKRTEITSIVQVKKTRYVEITMGTVSKGTFTFPALIKKEDETVNLLQELLGQ